MLCGVFGLLGRVGCDVPGQELFDAVDRMVGDTGQDISEIRFGIETIEFGGAYQAVDRSGSLAAGIGAGE